MSKYDRNIYHRRFVQHILHTHYKNKEHKTQIHETYDRDQLDEISCNVKQTEA